MQALLASLRIALLARLSDDPRILVLLVAWFFGLLMDGVAGFDTPVALAASILVGLGITPIRAVTLASLPRLASASTMYSSTSTWIPTPCRLRSMPSPTFAGKTLQVITTGGCGHALQRVVHPVVICTADFIARPSRVERKAALVKQQADFAGRAVWFTVPFLCWELGDRVV